MRAPWPARTYERKKNRPQWLLLEERQSCLSGFFTGGVEYDIRVDLAGVRQLAREFLAFTRVMKVPASWGSCVELKFRRLGRHRADGLYYPDQQVLAVDVASWKSFAHEFGHLIDYRRGTMAGPAEPTSTCDQEFRSFHEILLGRMREDGASDHRLSGRGGRLCWGYFSSALECFARAFEQCAAEILSRPSTIAGDPDRYRLDPLYFRKLPKGLVEYFQSVLSAGPRLPGLTNGSRR